MSRVDDRTAPPGHAEAGHVEAFLQQLAIHEAWASGYRTAENDRFYNAAFAELRTVLGVKPDSRVLDAGCGTGAHTGRIADWGAAVTAIDISASVLPEARRRSEGRNVRFLQSNLLRLPFADESFDVIVCWGVLMHVPDAESALAELARALHAGGRVAISEANFRSLQAITLRFGRRFVKHRAARIQRTDMGVEFWSDTGTGTLVTREADVPALIRAAGRYDLVLRQRRAGQFTELYTRFSSTRVRRFIHGVNGLWFRRARIAAPAFGNILVFEKN